MNLKKTALAAAALIASASMPTLAHATDLTMYMFYTSERDFFESVIDAFEQEHPDVNINLEVFENTAYDAALRAAFASGDVPDIICVEPDARAVGMYPLIEANQLVDLTDLYQREGWTDTFFKSVLDQLAVDGKYYSVPTTLNNLSMFYNVDMLKKYGLEVPKTYAELENMAQVLGADNIYPIAFGNRFPQRGRDYFYMIAGQTDPSIIKQADRGDISWTDQRLVAAAQTMSNMVSDGIFMPGVNAMSFDEQNQAFYVGRAAMVFTGGWDIPTFNANKPEGFNYSIARFPVVMDGGTGTSPGGVGQNFAIPAGGDNVDIAKDFLAFMLSEPVQSRFVAERYTAAAYAAPNEAATDPNQKIINQLQETNVVPRVLLNAKVLDALGGAIQGVISQEITPEEAMQETEDAR